LGCRFSSFLNYYPILVTTCQINCRRFDSAIFGIWHCASLRAMRERLCLSRALSGIFEQGNRQIRTGARQGFELLRPFKHSPEQPSRCHGRPLSRAACGAAACGHFLLISGRCCSTLFVVRLAAFPTSLPSRGHVFSPRTFTEISGRHFA